MVCLGLKPGVAEWKEQTNTLSYGGTPASKYIYVTSVVDGGNAIALNSVMIPVCIPNVWTLGIVVGKFSNGKLLDKNTVANLTSCQRQNIEHSKH